MNNQHGYTLAELVVSILIFGLIVGMMIPLFQEIEGSSWEQTAQVESIHLSANKLEQLARQCDELERGESQYSSDQFEHLIYSFQWECRKTNQGLIRIWVEVQWEDHKGQEKRYRLQTHRFQSKPDSPMSN